MSSQTIAGPEVADKILRFNDLTAELSESFQNEVYVKISKLLSEKIHRYNLLPINHMVTEKYPDSKEVKMSKKEIKEAKNC